MAGRHTQGGISLLFSSSGRQKEPLLPLFFSFWEAERASFDRFFSSFGRQQEPLLTLFSPLLGGRRASFDPFLPSGEARMAHFSSFLSFLGG